MYRYIKVLLFIALASTVAATNVVSADINLPPQITAGISLAQQTNLIENGEILNFFNNTDATKYSPQIVSQEFTALRLQGFSPSVGVEGIFLYSYKENSEFFQLATNQQHLVFYNILRAINSMEGIKYYSASRQKWRTFFEKSYVIASKDSNSPLPDPKVDSIPPYDTLYILQKDSSFGTNKYQADYQYRDNSFLLSINNIDPINYFIFKLVQPKGMHVMIALVPFETGIVYYAVSMIEAPNLFGFEERVEKSLTNRIKAMYLWFSEQLDTL